MWVVVPAHNEERLIRGTLDSLARQTDPDFRLVVVENASTDRTPEVVAQWIAEHPEVDASVVTEERKGTGAAADTGFRYAIERGADWVARTDADCLAAHDWVEVIRRSTRHARMLGGRIRARTDEIPLRPHERITIPLAVEVARLFGRLRPSNRSPGFLCPDVMCVGNNLAVEAATYVTAGGFPRLAIEELSTPNDRALVNRVRRVTPWVRYVPDMLVYNSIRRLRAYGLRRTLRWYADHRLEHGHMDVDVR